MAIAVIVRTGSSSARVCSLSKKRSGNFAQGAGGGVEGIGESVEIGGDGLRATCDDGLGGASEGRWAGFTMQIRRCSRDTSSFTCVVL